MATDEAPLRTSRRQRRRAGRPGTRGLPRRDWDAIRDDENVTPAEIAEKYQISPSAPVRWCAKGVLFRDGTRHRPEHTRTPGSYRIVKAAVVAFLESLARDRAGDPETEPPKPQPRSARVRQMKEGLARAGY
jgi:hypothetical protein